MFLVFLSNLSVGVLINFVLIKKKSVVDRMVPQTVEVWSIIVL